MYVWSQVTLSIGMPITTHYIMTQKVASSCGEYNPTSTPWLYCSSTIWNQYIDELGLPALLFQGKLWNKIKFDFSESKIFLGMVTTLTIIEVAIIGVFYETLIRQNRLTELQ